MDFNTQVETISSEQFDSLFSGNDTQPTATPGADNLIVGKDKVPQVTNNTGADIPFIDLDTLEEGTTEKTTEEAVAEPTEKVEEKVETEPKVEEPSQEDVDQSKVILKNTVNFLIEKGIWQDFDGRDDLELDEETYAELAVKQDEARLTDKFNELVDSTGDYGEAIISHIKNGGNPDEIIDIFKEQKQVGSQ